MLDLKKTLLSFVPKLIYKAVSSFVDRQVWNGYFVYSSELCKDVCEEDAKTIAGYLYKKPIVNIINNIRYELNNMDYSDETINAFVSTFTDIIKEKIPLVYILLEQEKLINRIDELEKLVPAMMAAIEEIKRNNPFIFDCLSIDEVENELRRLSHNKIGIDFFDFEDSAFEKELRKKLTSNDYSIIRINGRYSEETFYATLFQLKKLYPADYTQRVIVVESSRALNKIEGYLPNDAVIVCNTCTDDEDTPYLEGFLNIHIVSRVEKADINLRNRLKRTTINALEKSGFSTQEAESIINKSSNVYPIYKKALFSVTTSYITSICKSIDQKYISFALLFPKWSLSSKKDDSLIEEFLGVGTAEAYKALTPFSLDERPFVKKKQDSYFGEEACVVAFKDDSVFCDLKDKIETDQLNKFWTTAEKILLDVPSNFLDKNGLYSRSDEKCSEGIRASVLHTLTMLSLYFDQGIEKQVDSFVEKLLKNITATSDINQYRYLASILPQLAESSPRIVFSFLSKSINQKTLLYQFLTSANKSLEENYTVDFFEKQSIVRAFQLFLFLDDYKEKTIKLLFCIFSQEERRDKKDSIEETITNSLLAWVVMIPFSKDEKKKLLRWMFSYNSSAAFNICANLQFDSNCYAVHINEPNYLKYPRFEDRHSDYDIKDLFYYYASLLVKNASTPEQMINLIEKRVMLFYGVDFLKKTLNTIVKKTNSFHDDISEREEVSHAIRHFISNNRRHAKANWASSEPTIELFERALNKINYQRVESKYVHLFIDQRIDYPYPIVFDPTSKSSDFKQNEEKTTSYVEQKCDEFVKNNYDFEYLINCLNKMSISNPNIPNRHILFLFNQIERNKGRTRETDIFYRLIKRLDGNSACISTIAYLILKKHGVKSYFSIAKRIAAKEEDARLINYLSRYPINYNDKQYLAFIQSLSERQKSLYFKSLRGYSNIERSVDTLKFILNGIKTSKYNINEKNHYGSIIYYSVINEKSEVDLEEALKLISDVDQKTLFDSDDVSSISELITMFQEHFRSTSDPLVKSRIAVLELIFGFGLGGGYYKPIFLLNYLAECPEEYYGVIEKLFFKKQQSIEQGVYGNLYSHFLFVLNFCPGCIDNTFEEIIFDKWVNTFKKLVLKNGNTKENKKLFYRIMGKLCAYSPIDSTDRVSPNKKIRSFIEKIPEEFYETFSNSFQTSISNSVGVRTIGDGSDLLLKAKKYKEQADLIRAKYKKTSDILDRISDSFGLQASIERRGAEDE